MRLHGSVEKRMEVMIEKASQDYIEEEMNVFNRTVSSPSYVYTAEAVRWAFINGARSKEAKKYWYNKFVKKR